MDELAADVDDEVTVFFVELLEHEQCSIAGS
jgi:hypothetical protein